ncbi:MAG TPA: CFI-box-CTERM domain-containing protein [Bdellovibrionales bacterium]|nr:CFI-box-CTERM domain-containing protein [Bdellovibrionales bacterium]
MAEVEKLRECPSCHKKVPNLLRIDGGMRQRLRESTGNTNVPPEVCNDCYTDLTALISKGAQLKAQHHAKEQHRMVLWRNRVELLKQARIKMDVKAYSEAAVLYEKYLRVLEIIYDVKAGELTPDMFANRARSKELGVISMVYWDLLRIYDASPRYGDRQTKAAQKLVEFVRAAPPVGRKIIQQAKDFSKTAKNPAVVKHFINQTGFKKGRCFIATAAFASDQAAEVIYLQNFRDVHLERGTAGRAFISAYYFLSPPIARVLDRFEPLRAPVRGILKLIIKALIRSGY